MKRKYLKLCLEVRVFVSPSLPLCPSLPVSLSVSLSLVLTPHSFLQRLQEDSDHDDNSDDEDADTILTHLSVTVQRDRIFEDTLETFATTSTCLCVCVSFSHSHSYTISH